MNERIDCGGLMERGDLCLVEILGYDWRPGEDCGILTRFGEAGIPLAYLTIGHDAAGKQNMTFCVNQADMAGSRELLDGIRKEFGPDSLELCEPVVKLTLYGPHFLEKHALAGQVFSALCLRGINPQTVCSSVNSISVVVDAVDRDVTVECLRQKFDWPE